jgi:hypothetical protein
VRAKGGSLQEKRLHEEDGFIAPTTTSNFDLNFDLEEEEAGTTHARIRVV